MKGAPPAWITPVFRDFFANMIVPQLKTPEIFDPELIPRPMSIGVLSRWADNVEKAVEMLLQEHELDVKMLDIDWDDAIEWNFGELINQDYSIFLFKAAETLLINEKNSTLKLRTALDFIAKERNRLTKKPIVFLFCFEHLLNQRMADPNLEKLRVQFLQSLNKVAYLSAPNAAFRSAYFRYMIEEQYIPHVQKHLPGAACDLNYDELADYATFCHGPRMQEWLQRVFLDVVTKRVFCIDMDFVKTHLIDTSKLREHGGPHITPVDERALESAFSLEAGHGPLVHPLPKKAPVPPQEEKKGPTKKRARK